MRNIIIISILIFTSSSLAYSQESYIPGEIILRSDDTLRGSIETIPPDSLFYKCYFKESGKQKFQVYRPDKIKGYILNDKRIFISKNVNQEKENVFLEVLVKGTVSLYILGDKDQRFFIERDEVPLIELTKTIKQRIVHGYQETQTINLYKEVLKMVLGDNEMSINNIEYTALKRKSLESLILDYNKNIYYGEISWVNKDMEATKITPFSVYMLAGYANNHLRIESSADYLNKSSFTVGVGIEYMPLKKFPFFFLKLGVQNTALNYEKLYYNYTKDLPSEFFMIKSYLLSFKYELFDFPLSAGISIPVNKFTVSFTGGINLSKITNFYMDSYRIYSVKGTEPLTDFISKERLNDQDYVTTHYGIIGNLNTSYILNNSNMIFAEIQFKQRKPIEKNHHPLEYHYNNILSVNFGMKFRIKS